MKKGTRDGHFRDTLKKQWQRWVSQTHQEENKDNTILDVF